MRKVWVKSRFAARATVWVACLGLFSPGDALADDATNREVIRTYANFHLEKRDYHAANNLLQEHLRVDSKDAAAWNLIGLSYLQSQQNQHAVTSFRTAAGLTSDEAEKAVYLYNYSDALVRQGETGKAKEALVLAAKFSENAIDAEDAIRSLASGKSLEALDLAAPADWSLSVQAGGGYDTNVLLVSDASMEATGEASPFATTSARLGYFQAFGSRALEIETQGAYTYYTGDTAKLFNSIATHLTAQWGDAPDSTEKFTDVIGDEFDLSYLNTNGLRFYNWNESIYWKGTAHHNSSQQTSIKVPIGYNSFAVEDGDAAEDDRTGFHLGAGLLYEKFQPGRRFSAGIELERQFAKGSEYRANVVSLPVSWTESRLPWNLSGILEVEAGILQYFDSAESRRDIPVDLRFSLSRRVFGEVIGSLDYSFRRNFSNVSDALYSKHAVGVSLSHEIF